MRELYYIKAPLEELASFASYLIKRQIPVEYFGGISIGFEVEASRLESLSPKFRSMGRRYAKNHQVFEIEHYPM